MVVLNKQLQGKCLKSKFSSTIAQREKILYDIQEKETQLSQTILGEVI